jgi:shikimate kinase
VIRVVVLLGPPASGKSTVGTELGRLGFRWREWEPMILARWGSRGAFVAAKEDALPALHAEIRAWIDEPGPVAVIESTGLSDASFLDRLDAEGSAFTVRLVVAEDVAVARTAARPAGRHLADAPEDTRRIWREHAAAVAAHRRSDLVINTERTAAPYAAAQIVSALSARR